MSFEEGGTRIDDLKLIISRVAYASGLFDQDGIQVSSYSSSSSSLSAASLLTTSPQVRFMNSPAQGNNITNESAALQLVSQVRFAGLTPLGTELRNKVLEPLVMGPARRGQLQKPVLIIVVTDGVPVRPLLQLTHHLP